MLTLFLATLTSFEAPPLPGPMMIFFDSGGHDIRRDWKPVLDEAARLLQLAFACG